MTRTPRDHNWATTTWGHLATLEYGKALRDYDGARSMEKPFRVFGTNGPIGWHSKPLCHSQGIIVGRKGAYRGIHFSSQPFFVIDTAFYLKPAADFDLRWAYYQLKNFDINKIDSGAAIPSTSREAFYQIPVRVPPLETQRRITSILSAYDGLIENNTRRIAILEEIARRVYEEWFARFRFPGHEQVKMVESELGLIPENWEPTSVDQCVTVYRGKSYKGSELADEGGIPFVNLKCMERDGGFRKSGLKRYTGAYKDTHKVVTGDLVMGVTDMTQERRIVARCGRVPRLGADFGVVSMDLVKIETNKGIPKDYMYGMFRWSGFADEVKQHANGANVLHLQPDRISDFRFARPPAMLMQRYTDMVGPMLSQCDVLTEKNEVLRTTRDLLLPKLISGELDVSTLPEPEAIAA